MEKPQKSTQNHEQERPKTLKDYVVKTFPADLDVAILPLTVVRSSQDGRGIRHDGGWTPGDMLCLCDTDSRKGVGVPKLFVEVHKIIKINGEYNPITGFVALDSLQSLNVNGGFSESHIQARYGKSTKEMLKEGVEAAGRIWQQRHPDSGRIEPLVAKKHPENSSNSSVVKKDDSDHERPSISEVSPKTGSTAVKAAGIEKPAETSKVSTDSPVLVMTKEAMESIGAIKVNDSVGLPAVKPAKKPAEIDKAGANPADLVAAGPVKKPVEADKASADLVDLPAVESAKNPVETNEANADILPEGFKDAINSFKRNNNQFGGVARSLTGSLSELRELIKRNPAALKDSRITEFVTTASSIIVNLEASRVEILNSLIDEGFSKEMFVDSEKDPAEATGILVSKLAGLGKILGGVYAGHSDRDSLVQAIDEIIVDLSTVSGDRWYILDAVNKIKSVWGDDKS